MDTAPPPFSDPPLSLVAAPLPAPPPPELLLASRWRRLLAYLIDTLVLGIFAGLLAIPFYAPLCSLGPWGRLIGFCIATAYFGLTDSDRAGGQSIGKRLLRIRVVNADENAIPLEKSFLRSGLFLLPIFLNGLPLPITRTPIAILVLLNVFIFGLGGATVYMLLFNRDTRQGIHDLVAASYVVEARHDAVFTPKPIWKNHWAIMAAVVVLLVGGVATANTMLLSRGPFPELLKDVRMVESLHGVQQAGAFKLWSSTGNSATRQTLSITVTWRGDPALAENIAILAAQTILAKDAEAQNYDAIRVTVRWGYDLGISSRWNSQSYQHSPADWE